MQTGFHIMAKPIGPTCNLRCEYCFYCEKEALFSGEQNFRMSDEILEAYIRENIALNSAAPEIPFAWQGGEPTLLGLDFFRKVLELQAKYGNGATITNALQTNGTLLDEEWCRFLAEYKFLVGLSLDGPEDIHDRYRVDRGGKPTFQRVMRALKLMRKHDVAFNILACVPKETSKRPLDVYRFFKEQDAQFIQFIPIVERMPDAKARELGLELATPPSATEKTDTHSVSPWSVEPEAYGDFLITIFDEWVRNDVGSVSVMNFEWALFTWLGNESPVCHFAPRCGRSLIIEHNGDLYSCDHYVYPEYRLGNILDGDIAKIVSLPRQSDFGACKQTALPETCRDCKALFACNGGCPKHRFLESHSGEPGLNYLCKGYKKFFTHANKYMKVMVDLLGHGQPASLVMDAIKGPLVIKLDEKGAVH